MLKKISLYLHNKKSILYRNNLCDTKNSKKQYIILYRAFGGVVILKRIATCFFSEHYRYKLLEFTLHLNIRGPPHSDLISKIQIGGKESDF